MYYPLVERSNRSGVTEKKILRIKIGILNLMLFFILFLFELILLFALSKKLINSLTSILFRITRSHRAAIYTMAIIFLPGTIFHELAHLLFAGVMLVPVGEINVVPQIEENSVKLGSVQIGKTDPLRRTIVGVAPVLLGLILIFSIFLFVKIGVSPWWQVFLALYFIVQIGNTMFSSKKDLEGTVIFLIIISTVFISILFALYFLNPQFFQTIWSWFSKLNFGSIAVFFKQASIYLIIPVVLDIFIILFTRPFLRRSY